MVTLEVPLHAGVKDIIGFSKDYGLVAYGSFGCSPLNGGRPNTKVKDYFSYHGCCKSEFFTEVYALNAENIPFFLAYSNFFVSESELSDPENVCVLEFLSGSDVGNGVIVSNPLLRSFVRDNFPSLRIVSSCTRRFRSVVPLSSDKRISQYNSDLDDFDLVCLTPQDSRNLDFVSRLNAPERLIVIINSHCLDDCDSYWHYTEISVQNKQMSFSPDARFFGLDSFFHDKRMIFYDKCKGCYPSVLRADIISEYLSMGVRTFKIGRTHSLDDFADMVNFFDDIESLDDKLAA